MAEFEIGARAKEMNAFFFSTYCRLTERIVSVLNNNCKLLIFVFLYVCFVLAFFGHSFATNDDAGVMYDIQHGYRTILFAAPLGHLLSFFYLSINKDIPWYGLFLFAVHILCLFLFIKSLLRTGQDKHLIRGVCQATPGQSSCRCRDG